MNLSLVFVKHPCIYIIRFLLLVTRNDHVNAFCFCFISDHLCEIDRLCGSSILLLLKKCFSLILKLLAVKLVCALLAQVSGPLPKAPTAQNRETGRCILFIYYSGFPIVFMYFHGY